MGDSDALPGFLLGISFISRLSVAVGTVVLSLVLFFYAPLITHNAIIFFIPVALVSWMFRRRGLYFCIFILLVTTWLYYSKVYGTLLLPLNIVLYYIINTLALMTVGFFVSSQRRLLDLVGNAQEQLYGAYEELHKLNQIKDQFLQNMNHEIRTPLTAVYGYLELLLVHDEQLSSPMRATFLENAMQSCDELQLLVNNVLDSMGLESEKRCVQVEELPVIDIVYDVLEHFDPKTVQTHTINIDIPEYVVVRANAQYTRQVLRNLLSNAFKYAPEGTPITISAALYGDVVQPLHPAPEIYISVKDAGPGIPPQEIPLLFGQFVRLRRDTSGRVRGSGLGLFLSKQFVELMGGKIWVESEGVPGKGSNFIFTLPCVPRPTVKAKIKSEGTLYVPMSADS